MSGFCNPSNVDKVDVDIIPRSNRHVMSVDPLNFFRSMSPTYGLVKLVLETPSPHPTLTLGPWL